MGCCAFLDSLMANSKLVDLVESFDVILAVNKFADFFKFRILLVVIFVKQ